MKHLLLCSTIFIWLGIGTGCVATRIDKAYVVSTEQHPKITAKFIQSLEAKAIEEHGFSVDERFGNEPNLTLRKMINHNGGRFEIWLGVERKSDEVRIWVSYSPQLTRSFEIEQIMQFISKELEAWGAVGIPIETSSAPFV